MKKNTMQIYKNIFLKNFYISAFTFGGGYVVIPMIRKFFVEELELVSEADLLDMAAIAQSTPGAIAVNLAVLVAYKIKGLKGAIIGFIATILPPLLILSMISISYDAFRSSTIIAALLKGMEAGVAATIVDLVLDMSLGVLKERNIIFSLFIPLAFISSFLFNLNVLLIILLSVLISIIQVLVFQGAKI